MQRKLLTVSKRSALTPEGSLLVPHCLGVVRFFDVVEHISAFRIGVDLLHVFRGEGDFTDEVEWAFEVKIFFFGALADIELCVWILVWLDAEGDELHLGVFGAVSEDDVGVGGMLHRKCLLQTFIVYRDYTTR